MANHAKKVSLDADSQRLRQIDAMLARTALKAPPMELVKEDAPAGLSICFYCCKPVLAKGMCRAHYYRTRRQAKAIDSSLVLGDVAEFVKVIYRQDVEMIADLLEERFRAGDFSMVESEPESYADGSAPGVEKFLDIERQFFGDAEPFRDEGTAALVLVASEHLAVVPNDSSICAKAKLCLSLDVYFLAKARGWLPPLPGGAWTPEQDYSKEAAP